MEVCMWKLYLAAVVLAVAMLACGATVSPSVNPSSGHILSGDYAGEYSARFKSGGNEHGSFSYDQVGRINTCVTAGTNTIELVLTPNEGYAWEQMQGTADYCLRKVK